MSTQSPQQCKNADASKWMHNDRDQTPCQVLSSSLSQFDPSFDLNWLDLSFSCPREYSRGNTTNQLSEYCCSSVSFSLFSSCWACQWDQPVQGYVRTTWGNYSSNCSINPVVNGTGVPLAQVGALSSGVQSALAAANIRIPTWAFLSVMNNSTWDELAAKANATVVVPSNSGPNQLSQGAIAGISIGSFIVFCILLFVFTVMCMRKKQRHRLEAFRHRSASIFGHKKRVVNLRDKPVGARGREKQGKTARVDLALEGDGLASPISVKGGLAGGHRVNADLTMDIGRDAMSPALVGGEAADYRPARDGVGATPQRECPESGSGMAARLQSNVRRSLARLGRFSQPGRTSSPQSHGLTPTTGNRHTHPMRQMSPSAANPPFAVPFYSSDHPTSNATGRPAFSAPPSAWPTDALDPATAHPLTQQQLHPQLSRKPPTPVSALSLTAATKPTPMPLTKEALSLARVAQDGTLFVLGEPELHHGAGKTRGANESRPVHPQQQQQPLVHTLSIERNPAQMQRHADLLPRRSDSLRRSQVQTQGPGQGQQQMGLVLHEAIMDGSVPRRKTPSRQKDRGEATSGPIASTSRTSPAVDLGTSRPTASTSAATGSQRHPVSAMGVLAAPIARKPVPKSDSSVLANAGSAIGSSPDLGEDDESIAALEIRHITGSATGTSGSGSGSGSAGRNGRGRGKGKKRGRISHDIRLSLAANTSLSSAAFGVKSDGTRTPSPKVAPSAEWFDLFRRGTVPMLGGEKWPGIANVSSGPGPGEPKPELMRNKTVPVVTGNAGGSMSTALPGTSKAGTAPLSPTQKRYAFQSNALAGPSMSSFERTRTQSASDAKPGAGAVHHTPFATLYAPASTSSLTVVASNSIPVSWPNTGSIRKSPSAQNLSEPTPAPALTTSLPTSVVPAAAQPSTARALPTVSLLTTHHRPPPGTQTTSLPSPFTAYATQMTSESGLPQIAPTVAHSHMPAQLPPSSVPLPIPPSASVSHNTLSQPRITPGGARPVRRLPTIPPQSPSG